MDKEMWIILIAFIVLALLFSSIIPASMSNTKEAELGKELCLEKYNGELYQQDTLKNSVTCITEDGDLKYLLYDEDLFWS